MLGLKTHRINNKNKLQKIRYPLDEFGGASVAFSLRNLTEVWKDQAVIRVRRSSDNTEQDFTAIEIIDGTLESFCGVGDGHVAIIYDQSGNGIDAQKSVASQQPNIITNGTLEKHVGKPILVFDGSDDVLFTNSFPQTQEGTVISVCVLNSVGLLWGVRTNASNNRQWSVSNQLNRGAMTLVNRGGSVQYINLGIYEYIDNPDFRISILSADGVNNMQSYFNGTDQIIDLTSNPNEWFADVMAEGDSIQFGTKSDGLGIERGYSNLRFCEFINYSTYKHPDREEMYKILKTYY